VAIERDRYAVVSTDDLTLHGDGFLFDSAIEADAAMKRVLSAHPELAGAVQVMPAAALEPVEA
jgi:hypothetical protein